MYQHKRVPHRHSHNFAAVAPGGRLKSTTRHLAALDFLSSISMCNEVKIKEEGEQYLERSRFTNETRDNKQIAFDADFTDGQNGQDRTTSRERDRATVVPSVVMDAAVDSAPGRKLPGEDASSLRIPLEFRYKTQTGTSRVRRWEEQFSSSADEPLLASRLFYSRSRGYPLLTSSVIKYDAGEEKARLETKRLEDMKGEEVYQSIIADWRGCSYRNQLKYTSLGDYCSKNGLAMNMDNQGEMGAEFSGATLSAVAAGSSPNTHTGASPEGSALYLLERGYLHDPNFLDDPNMRHAEHRYVLHRGAATGPILSSIILYANASTLKQSLNEQFKELHSNLPPSLNYSEVKNLTKSLIIGCMKLGLELATGAMAYIYFETLCLKCLVTKSNRTLSMAVSLLLAYKFNEPPYLEQEQNGNQVNTFAENESSPTTTNNLHHLLEFMDNEWDISKKDLFAAEFGAYVHLNFSLHVPAPHVKLIVVRFLKSIHKTPRQYFGDTDVSL